MALSPQITACIVEGCKKLRVYDVTGTYSVANTGGWGAPNIQGSDIVYATITYSINGGTEVSIDVAAEIPTTVVGDFVFTDIDVEDDYEDGEMEITYTIEGPVTTYTATLCTFFSCNARCCIDNMWASIAGGAGGDCTCDTKKLVEDALFAEGLLQAAKSVASCNNETTRNSLLEKIQLICNFDDCNCS